MNRLTAVLATAMLVVPAGAAIANPFAKSESAVRYTDLDLSTAAGRQRLDVRLDQAAADVCGRGFDRIHPTLAQQAATCRHDVAAETREKITQRIAARDVTPTAGLVQTALK